MVFTFLNIHGCIHVTNQGEELRINIAGFSVQNLSFVYCSNGLAVVVALFDNIILYPNVFPLSLLTPHNRFIALVSSFPSALFPKKIVCPIGQ